MYNSLNELSMLSLSLQNREITLPEADKPIRRSIRRIDRLKENPGPTMSTTQSAADGFKFVNTT